MKPLHRVNSFYVKLVPRFYGDFLNEKQIQKAVENI